MRYLKLASVSIAAAISLMACGGGSGSPTSAPVTPAPTITMAFAAPIVNVGSNDVLTWSSSNATSCTASGAWSGIQSISGTYTVNPSSAGQITYSLTCNGAGGTTTKTIPLTANAILQTFSGCQSNSAPNNVVGIFGGFTVQTSTWNPAGAASYNNCMNATINSLTNTGTAEFNWDVVSSTTPGVVAYPNFTSGWQPGYDHSNSILFPMAISSMKDVVATGSIVTTCQTSNCMFDSAFDIFFSNSPTPTKWPPTHEMLILTSYKYAWGLGTPNATVSIDGITFQVFVGAVTPPGGTDTWNIISYVPSAPIQIINLNIKKFVMDASNRGYVNPSEYVASVALGTEVIVGKGTTLITNFNLK
jgi:hypothetical protein